MKKLFIPEPQDNIISGAAITADPDNYLVIVKNNEKTIGFLKMDSGENWEFYSSSGMECEMWDSDLEALARDIIKRYKTASVWVEQLK
jgi:hypothetical protein